MTIGTAAEYVILAVNLVFLVYQIFLEKKILKNDSKNSERLIKSREFFIYEKAEIYDKDIRKEDEHEALNSLREDDVKVMTFNPGKMLNKDEEHEFSRKNSNRDQFSERRRKISTHKKVHVQGDGVEDKQKLKRIDKVDFIQENDPNWVGVDPNKKYKGKIIDFTKMEN